MSPHAERPTPEPTLRMERAQETPRSAPAHIAPGATLDGRYRLIRLLGQGGMGAVFEAEDERTRRRVALKLIHTERRPSDALLSRFRREARAAMAVASNHIARLLDAGVDPRSGAPYLVFELLQGEDLAAVLARSGPLSPSAALRIIGQACAGLERAHAAGILHRDIKPANLFLARGADGTVTVKIIDFGVAKFLREPGADGTATLGLTRTGDVVGSPRYMSPEQARGSRELDARADLWSLGVVLYEALCGRTPHAQIDALGALLLAVCFTPAPPLCSIAPWVPAEAAAIAGRALALDRDDRFPRAADMLRTIRDARPDGLALREGDLAPLDLRPRTPCRTFAPCLTTTAPAGTHAGASAAPTRASPRR